MKSIDKLSEIDAKYKVRIQGISKLMNVSKSQLKKYIKSLFDCDEWRGVRVEFDVRVHQSPLFEGDLVNVVVGFE